MTPQGLIGPSSCGALTTHTYVHDKEGKEFIHPEQSGAHSYVCQVCMMHISISHHF